MTHVLVVSDFNADLVSRYIAADRSAPAFQSTATPYGQVFQALASPEHHDKDGVGFIWTRPQGVVPQYLQRIEGAAVDMESILAGVDAFAGAVRSYASHVRLVLVASWTSSASGRGLGMLDWSRDGLAGALARMNIRLADALADLPNVFILNAQSWLDGARPARDDKYWYTMKSPYTEAVCQAAAKDVKAAVRGVEGLARKLIVLDLDNTLWGGIVGDDGVEGLQLGGHSATGEAYVEFQKALKALSRRGVALAVASKNDEAVALKAIDEHPAMVLRRDDLAAWRINWNDKAQNIVDLVKTLNLGLQSVVFIDDNPTERGRVADALPDVLTPDWPKDPARYAEALRQLDCFDQPHITGEDRARVQMYAQQRSRDETLAVAGSAEDWLASLDIKVAVEPVAAANLKRSVQLLNKTNQMNLATRRLTEAEYSDWTAQGAGRQALALNVADRFGDIGLTGLLSWEVRGRDLEVVDFVLSCRAMGRQVETLMAALAFEAALALGCDRVRASFVPTERNRPCLEFWQGSGFTQMQAGVFERSTDEPYARPVVIAVEQP